MSHALASDSEWVALHVPRFAAVRPRYAQYAGVLAGILQKAAKTLAPDAIVQTRPKAVASFAEKILRKRDHYDDPLVDMTDLCGGRVIVHTTAEVQRIADFIERHFEIDRANSEDVSGRMRTTEFGYRSVHYIVTIRAGMFPCEGVPVEAPPEETCGLKAEIQVRTVLEHAWADIGHDLTYKSPFRIPEQVRRRAAALAATLEAADREFGAILEEIAAFGAQFGDAFSPERAREEIGRLRIVLDRCGPDPAMAARIARLANHIGEWSLAMEVLRDYRDDRNRVVQREIGKVLARSSEPRTVERQEARLHLERAISGTEPDLEALIALAELCVVDGDSAAAKRHYRRASAMDPSRPDVLAGYLTFEIEDLRHPEIAQLTAPVIRQALARCRRQIDGKVSVAASFWHSALFRLMLGEPVAALSDLARAIALSPGRHALAGWRAALARLKRFSRDFEGLEHLDLLLLLGQAARHGCPEALAELRLHAVGAHELPSGPVVILAGGCSPHVQELMADYRCLLVDAFAGFAGTVVSGGTVEGIGGLCGDVAAAYPGVILALAYLPRHIPTDAHLDPRYGLVHRMAGDLFSVREPLQSWIDLVVAGVEPADVRLLGINGGPVAAAEYRIALALGAQVALLNGSGREADRLVKDPDWAGSGILLPVPADPTTLNAFLLSGGPSMEKREEVAKAIHEEYRERKGADLLKAHAPARPWEVLEETYRQANLSQADHIAQKLARIGCHLGPLEPASATPFAFTQDELDELAEMEHGRWNMERLREGWRHSPRRDDAKRLHDALVPWEVLPAEVREWDYHAVRAIPKLLAGIGLRIERDEPAGAAPPGREPEGRG
ncbi:MAG: RyR domain-containing protein [Pseudomonadota bacterium]